MLSSLTTSSFAMSNSNSATVTSKPEESFGVGSAYDTHTSEYDLYVSIKNNKNNKNYLNKLGITNDVIDQVLNGSVEKELLHRKTLSDDVLSNYGYDDNDIRILKNYNGEQLESVPAAAALLGTIYTNLNVPTKTDDVVYVNLKWWWDIAPIIKMTDSIGATWWANTDANLQLLTDVSQFPSKCTVTYVNTSTSAQTLKRIYAHDITSDGLIYLIPMGELIQPGVTNIAMKGVLDVSVSTRGGHNMNYYHFKSSYAHNQLQVANSIGLSLAGPSLGFYITTGYSEVVHRHVSMTPTTGVVREPDDR